jgi:hypothetical protein
MEIDTMRERIALHTLPERARPLDAMEVQTVFGGCGNDWAPCKSSKDCCDAFVCDRGLLNQATGEMKTYCRLGAR